MDADRSTIDSGLSVLVVEDEPLQRELLTAQLQALGVDSVWAAANGHQALKLLDAGLQFDVMLCDLMMPQMDGIQLIHHLGEKRFAGGLLLISALPVDLLQSAEAMAAEHGLRMLGQLEKPVTTKQLCQSLRQYQPQGDTIVPSEHLFSLDEIRAGLQQNQFIALYQPKVRFDTGELVGVESLVRWEHPDKGIIAPGFFVPQLERSGEIGLLSEIVSRAAFRQCRSWLRQRQRLSVAINIPATVMEAPAFLQQLQEITARYQIPSELVVIELTESDLGEDIRALLASMLRMRMHGFRLAIDDFGTGYASLRQLQQMPFSELKIDQGFIRAALDNDKALAIVETSLELAQRIGLTTVAEGVENAALWELLRSLNCEVCQGYHVARPLPGEAVLDWYRQWRHSLVRE